MMYIAGPCSIEDEKFIDIAIAVKKCGATHLRGGIFKPRSSPFRWSGLGDTQFQYVRELVLEAKRLTGLPFVCEAMKAQHINRMYDFVDVFQVGARNQQDSELLKEFGRQDKPVILKRGMATTIEEFVMASDFIRSEGNSNIILCERGIRTFEGYTRNTFDINCIAAMKDLCSLPIISDASHGTGRRELVIPITLASLVAGASGFMVEVHNEPELAMTDGEQSLTIEMFGELMKKVKALNKVLPEVVDERKK